MVFQFDIVCKKGWLDPFLSSMKFMGSLIGMMFCGVVSDQSAFVIFFIMCECLLYQILCTYPLTLDLPRCRFRHQVIFKFNFCKICVSCEFEVYWLFLKKLLHFKDMVGAILFHFCHSCLITLIFAPRRIPRCCFRYPMPEDSQN